MSPLCCHTLDGCQGRTPPRLPAGQVDREGRAPAGLATDGDTAAVRLHELSGDGQAQAAPGVNGPGPRGVAAPEAVEDKRQVLRRDALSGVCYLDTYSFMVRLCPHQGDGPAVAGVADGVRDEVSEDLLESTGVGHDGEGTVSVDGYSQGYSRRLGLATEAGRNVVEEIGNI